MGSASGRSELGSSKPALMRHDLRRAGAERRARHKALAGQTEKRTS